MRTWKRPTDHRNDLVADILIPLGQNPLGQIPLGQIPLGQIHLGKIPFG